MNTQQRLAQRSKRLVCAVSFGCAEQSGVTPGVSGKVAELLKLADISSIPALCATPFDQLLLGARDGGAGIWQRETNQSRTVFCEEAVGLVAYSCPKGFS